jgi:anti-anti-sigma factor
MLIRVWADGPVWVVEVLGNLTAAELPALLDRLAEAAADEKAAGVVLMLGAVHQVDAAGVAAVRAAREALAEHGGRLVLTGANAAVASALNTAGLPGASAVCESLEDALKTLRAAR